MENKKPNNKDIKRQKTSRIESKHQLAPMATPEHTKSMKGKVLFCYPSPLSS